MGAGPNKFGQRIEAEKALAFDLANGITRSDEDDIKQALAVAEAEKRIADQAISETNRQMIHQFIKVDVFNIQERYVELTPSMCTIQNCGWDAARELGKGYGISDWSRFPLQQELPGGETVGDRLIKMRERHEATAHSVNERPHIVTEAELRRRQQTQNSVFSAG